MQNILEVGSIIKLKATGMELMIVGYYPINDEDGSTYDYLCVNSVAGMISEESFIAINEDAIESVVFHGYRSETDDKFFEELEGLKNKH